MRLLALFVAVPLVEIALLISVGGLIGLWPTLAVVLLTAVLGTALVRSQGAAVLRDARSSSDSLRGLAEPLAHGAMILLAGALLLTPGFFTDACGFALLIPALRIRIFRLIAERITIVGTDSAKPPRDDDEIHAEYEVASESRD